MSSVQRLLFLFSQFMVKPVLVFLFCFQFSRKEECQESRNCCMLNLLYALVLLHRLLYVKYSYTLSIFCNNLKIRFFLHYGGRLICVKESGISNRIKVFNNFAKLSFSNVVTFWNLYITDSILFFSCYLQLSLIRILYKYLSIYSLHISQHTIVRLLFYCYDYCIFL